MNFCAEFRWRRHRATWWALTQAEETLEGFDAVAKSARAAFVFQFKAASNIVGGRRRYVADHDQMKLLVSLARRVGGGRRRIINYDHRRDLSRPALGIRSAHDGAHNHRWRHNPSDREQE